jgi:hypothetical protein
VSISDGELATIRSTGAYRGAVWLTRFNHLPLLALYWLTWTGRAGVVRVPLFVVFTAGIVGGLVLLHRSGVPFVTRFLSWRVEDKRALRQLMRDVYWPRRP